MYSHIFQSTFTLKYVTTMAGCLFTFFEGRKQNKVVK